MLDTIRERIAAWRKSLEEKIKPRKLSDEQKAALKAMFAKYLEEHASEIESWIRLSAPDEVEALLVEVFNQFLATLKTPPA